MSEKPDATDLSSAEEIAALDQVTRRLRRDCPWDRKQDQRSIVPHTVEEAYELADAAMRDDDEAMLDELGDVLFQVHFLSLLMEERGAGSMAAAARHCREKLIRRHPHVYGPGSEALPQSSEAGGEVPATADEVLANWDRIKTDLEGRGSDGVFSDVPENLPALLYARKAQRRAASRIEGQDGLAPGATAAARRAEELGEAAGRAAAETARARHLVDAGADGSPGTGSAEREALERAIGKALFALVDLSRQAKIDPELALRAETARYMADCDAGVSPP